MNTTTLFLTIHIVVFIESLLLIPLAIEYHIGKKYLLLLALAIFSGIGALDYIKAFLKENSEAKK